MNHVPLLHAVAVLGVLAATGCAPVVAGTLAATGALGSGGGGSGSSLAPGPAPAPTRLAFAVGPTGALTGATITPAVVVELHDDSGALADGGVDVTLSLPQGASALLGGTTTVRALGGRATFDGLIVDRAASGLRLQANAAGLTGATSASFDVTAPPDDHGDDAAGATSIARGSPAAGRIEVAGDEDWFAVPLAGGGTYALQTRSLAAGMDSVLDLFDVDGATLLATNDDHASVEPAASRIDVTPAASGAYFLRVRHVDGTSGQGTYQVLALELAAPAAPARPANLTATAAGLTRVSLSWTDASTNETGFRVERREGGGSFDPLASLPAGSTTFDDLTVAPSTTYEYRLVALNAVGDSTPSDVAQVTTPAPPRPRLVFPYRIPDTPSDRPFNQILAVSALDAPGAPVTSGVAITLTLVTNPTGAVLGGTRTRTTHGGGAAQFDDLTIDRIGQGYVLEATAAGYDPATSPAFDVFAGLLVTAPSS